jgi:formate dehydrogenase subunit delta
MRVERLVTMANDIGHFFGSDADKAEASKNIAAHLKRFWDPRMLREIVAHYITGGAGLEPVVHDAVGILADS